MRKFYGFVRSMKFGIILLLVVAAFSVVGSLIPQTFDDPWYIENYPEFGELLLTLGLHRMFSQWYFIVVCVLLGLSLANATISRIFALRKLLPDTLVVPEEGYRHDELDEIKISRLRTYLQKKRYRELTTNEATVYHKNRLGYFGSAVVHLSLLMILLFGGLVLALNYDEEVILLPGETATLSDGSTLRLFSFTRTDPITERTESISIIEVVAPDGRSSGVREIRVNSPLRFNSFVYYQFQHMYAGSITAVDIETGASDTFYLTERSFLTTDDRTGIWFETVFQGWTMEEETGRIIPLIYDAPIFPDPLYYFLLMDHYIHEHRFAVPGTHVHVGNIRFEFNELIHYPNILVSYSPHPFPALLLAGAILLMVGLALSFYFTPVIVVLRGNRYKITGSKSSGIDIEIIAMLYEGEDVPKDNAPPNPDEPIEEQKTEREVDI
ncbi:MAG: cytochrome c biogenesis protein ResB [Defluviitaleaceae bacterium]|nr:cytochrome c biogenesis protein ResB [Defluviitaleaceae bacterium]